MIHQRQKDLAFLLLAKATLPNYWRRRLWNSVRSAPTARHLHLGCGPHYLPGFINIDANPRHKLDIWLDVRCGLPFADQTVDSIYTTHMLEHFYPDELQQLLRECRRVLRLGGGMRIIVPNLASAIQAYTAQREKWFQPYPLAFDSLGGKFSNFVFCSGQHRTAFDYEYLNEILCASGFRHTELSAEGKSVIYQPSVPKYEAGEEIPHSLYVEALR